MGYAVIEDMETRDGTVVTRRKIYQTDDSQFPSGYRYGLHYGFTDGRGTILRYDNETETPGRHTPDGIEKIEFPGMMTLRDRLITEIEDRP